MKRLFVVAALLARQRRRPPTARPLFASKCAACHGPDGKGQSAMGKKLGVKDLTASKLTAAEMEDDRHHGQGEDDRPSAASSPRPRSRTWWPSSRAA